MTSIPQRNVHGAHLFPSREKMASTKESMMIFATYRRLAASSAACNRAASPSRRRNRRSAEAARGVGEYGSRDRKGARHRAVAQSREQHRHQPDQIDERHH